MGGSSVEREISLITGEQIRRALRAKGFKTTGIDLDRDIVSKLRRSRCQVVFIALHGVPGEDGTIQGLLDILGLPYVGSGVLASAVGMDKIRSKMLFSAMGIPAPFHISVNRIELGQGVAGQLVQRLVGSLGLPLVVKPATTGSAIGVKVIERKDDILPALEDALKFGNEAIVEEHIAGTEITIGLLGNERPRVLPAVEIVPERGFYDFEAKYTPGMSRHLIPPRASQKVVARAEKFALAAHVGLGCRGLSRVDFIIDKEEHLPYILEINTIPGMTPTSLFPEAARSAGIEFEELVEDLVRLALER
jgi:D-alanine-D-alanine ligase